MDMLIEEISLEIAEVAGKVYKGINQEVEVMRRKYMRHQIEIDIHKPLIPGCYIDGWDGNPQWVLFKYERLPFYCKKCGVLDHLDASCRNDVIKNRFGIWLRAESEVTWEPELMEGVGGSVTQTTPEDGEE